MFALLIVRFPRSEMIIYTDTVFCVIHNELRNMRNCENIVRTFKTLLTKGRERFAWF